MWFGSSASSLTCANSWAMSLDRSSSFIRRTANSRNANFLLNVGPDKQGKFQDASVKVLTEVGELLEQKESNSLTKKSLLKSLQEENK